MIEMGNFSMDFDEAWAQPQHGHFPTTPDFLAQLQREAKLFSERRLAYKLAKRKQAEKLIGVRIDDDPRALPSGVYLIRRPKLFNPLGSHYGVLVVWYGVVTVYDLQDDEGPRKAITFAKFAENRPVFRMDSVPPGDGSAAVFDRLNEAIDKYQDWRLWNNNCEHWARYVVTGVHTSGQTNGLGLLGGLAVLVMLAG